MPTKTTHPQKETSKNQYLSTDNLFSPYSYQRKKDIIERTFDWNPLNPVAKKVSIAIIVILIGVIGYLWYLGGQKKDTGLSNTAADLQTATSSETIFDLRAYAAGRANMEKIVSEQASAANEPVPNQIQPEIPTKFSSSNLIIYYSENTANLKYYGQQIAKTLKPYGQGQESEITTMLQALESRDANKAEEVAKAAQRDKQTISALLKIAVPKSAQDIHLNLVNSLSQSSALLTDMSKILDSPYLALTSADTYRVQQLSFYKAVDEINQYFRNKEITFSPEEGGSILINI